MDPSHIGEKYGMESIGLVIIQTSALIATLASPSQLKEIIPSVAEMEAKNRSEKKTPKKSRIAS